MFTDTTRLYSATMPAQFKLCQCTVHRCQKKISTDKDTGQEVSGAFLTLRQYQQHQTSQLAWARRNPHNDEEDISQTLLATTLASLDLTDASVTHSKLYDEEEDALAMRGDDTPPPSPPPLPRSSFDDAQKLLRDIDEYRQDFINAQKDFFTTNILLTFPRPPTSADEPTPKLEYTSRKGSSNRFFLDHQGMITRLIDLADALDPTMANCHSTEILNDVHAGRKLLVKELQQHQDHIDSVLQQQWLARKSEAGLSPSENSSSVKDNGQSTCRFTESTTHLFRITGRHFDPVLEGIPGPMGASILVVVTIYLLAGLSRESSNFLLNALCMVVVATCTYCAQQTAFVPPPNHPWIGSSHPESPSATTSATTTPLTETSNWPRDIRTALHALNLDPDTVHYACCKKCFSIYPPKSKEDPQYPTLCTFRETEGSRICGTKLLQGKSRGEGVIPIRRYIYQPLTSWLGRMLSRTGFENRMANPSKPGNYAEMTDIWHGTAFNDFNGPDGKWFFDSPEEELRLSFSLFIDWFNPYGRKRGGKLSSVGAIYMVCMNLPPHLRYQVENVYLVGIIPGPNEPSLHHLNHILRPLVAELRKFWFTGVFYSRTSQHKFGRLVKCVLIPLVCDLPAIRKATGFMGPTANIMCSICELEKKDISNFDVENWPRRDWHAHDQHARRWKGAKTEADRDEEFEKNHIRWTELLDLPYWNIMKFSVVDTMHNFFEGDVKRHILRIWGMSSSAVDPSTKRNKPHTPDQQAKSLQSVAAGIEARSVERIIKSGNHIGYIIATAKLNEVKPPEDKPAKKDWAAALVDWVRVI